MACMAIPIIALPQAQTTCVYIHVCIYMYVCVEYVLYMYTTIHRG